MTEYFTIGKLAAVHGVQGELVLRHMLGKQSALKGLSAIFIEDRKDSFLPWFIETARIKNDEEIFLKLEQVDSREAAVRLLKKEVWVTEKDFKKLAAPSSPISLLGYSIIDHQHNLGPILEVIEQPHQLLCRLEIGQKEALIPLHEQSLKKIDHKKKEVHVELPDGLLDIYKG
ncbi:MAG: 16S rRNA processing protein RimM [Terrimonas sp.]|nr:16S rRNA processing protein RimM [Terrimonas sp.]